MFGQSPASLVVCAGVLLAYVVNKHTQLTRKVAISMGFCGLAAGNREINKYDDDDDDDDDVQTSTLLHTALHCPLHCS